MIKLELPPNEVNLAISAGLGGKEPTWDTMLAAIEGAAMGGFYLLEVKSNKETIAEIALRSLVEAVGRYQNGVC